MPVFNNLDLFKGPGKIGICVSGQTISQLCKRVRDRFYHISDKIIVMIGTNDFLKVSKYSFKQFFFIIVEFFRYLMLIISYYFRYIDTFTMNTYILCKHYRKQYFPDVTVPLSMLTSCRHDVAGTDLQHVSSQSQLLAFIQAWSIF